MDADEYRRMADTGERHWWYRNTRLLLAQLLVPHLEGRHRPMVLDAGGGTGATGGWMTRYGTTVLADVEPMALQVARTDHGDERPATLGTSGTSRVARGHGLLAVQADLNWLPFADASFDAVLCVTALCHRMNPDPAAIVRDFARITKPGGVVCLMEPGVKRLWRGHDEVTHTGRRFSVGDLREMAEGAGLTVDRATGAYSFLVPPAAILGVVERGKQKSDVGRNESGLGGTFSALARTERWLLRRRNLPAGLSAIVVATRPV